MSDRDGGGGCFGCGALVAVIAVAGGLYVGRIQWERWLTEDRTAREAETVAIATDACADATRPLLDRIDDLEARVDQLEHETEATAGDAFLLESRVDDLETRRRW